MRGTIVTRMTKDGSKRYHVVYRVDGKQRWKTFTRQKAAEKFLGDTVKAVHDGTYREVKPITFKAYAEKWLETLADLKPSTRRTYKSVVERQLIPAFGERILGTLRPDDVNAYLAHCETPSAPEKKSRTLKPKTRRNILLVLHKLLEDARAAGHCAMHALAERRAVRRPKALRPEYEHEMEILNPEEVNTLLDKIHAHYVPLYLTAVSTGMRLGELLGLQWGDVDRTARQIYVRRSLYKGQLYLPKSKGSRRSIDVGDQVLGTLAALEAASHGEQGRAPARDHVFLSPEGRLTDPDNLRNRVWEPAIRAAGLRHVTQHSLRHTYASLLIAQGESIKYVQGQLGHASAAMTLNVYGHLFPQEKRASAERLEAQLRAGREKVGGAAPI